MDTLVGERDPRRRVIARLLPSTDIAIDACAGQAGRQRPAQNEVIDAKARVALERVAQILPQRFADSRVPPRRQPSRSTSSSTYDALDDNFVDYCRQRFR
jgi:hypothetical protein